MKYAKYILITFILLYTNIAKAYELPDLGERSETYLSPRKEKLLGKEFMKAVRLNLSVLDDPIINDYIQTIGNRLVSHAYTRKKFHFFVVNDNTVNAFAGPAGYIGINSGTITATESESELAGVMSHEIAHVSQHHIERLFKKASDVQLAAMATTLAAIIAGVAGYGNIASGATMATMGGAAQHMINFTREHEIEADNIGITILYQSSFDPHAVPTFFERMQRLRYSSANEIPKFLQNHPVTSDRIAESKNRANKYGKRKVTTPNIFYLIKNQIEVITSKNLTSTIKSFKIKLNNQQPKNKIGLQYGYALALYKNHQFAEAEKILTDLQKEHPNEILFQMLAAKLAVKNKQFDKAITILKAARTNHENYYPLIIEYGKTLITAKHTQAACDFIRAKTRQYPDNVDLQRLLAEAYAQNGQKAYAYQAKAKAYEIEGYNRQAVVLLRQAAKIPKLSTNNRAIISAKIQRLKKIEKNN